MLRSMFAFTLLFVGVQALAGDAATYQITGRNGQVLGALSVSGGEGRWTFSGEPLAGPVRLVATNAPVRVASGATPLRATSGWLAPSDPDTSAYRVVSLGPEDRAARLVTVDASRQVTSLGFLVLDKSGPGPRAEKTLIHVGPKLGVPPSLPSDGTTYIVPCAQEEETSDDDELDEDIRWLIDYIVADARLGECSTDEQPLTTILTPAEKERGAGILIR